jgi:hypothetical protein
MTAWTEAVAALADARERGDARGIGAAQRTLARMTAAQLRAELRPEPEPLLSKVAATVARVMRRLAA